jgi:hypothetical protein
MKARFRVRVAGGREFTLDTLDAFARRVHAGDITPYDLVFDGLTGEWAPARSHPAYRLSVDPLVTGTDVPLSDEVDVAEDGASGGQADRSVQDADPAEMALVDVDAPSPDEEKRAFIARMDEERRADPDRAPLEAEIPLMDPRSGMVAEIVPEPAYEDDRETGATGRPTAGEPVGSPYRPVARRAPRFGPTPPPGHRWSSWAGFFALLCVGLAGTATVAWSALRTSGPFPRSEPSFNGAARAARPIVPMESAVRAGAYAGFLHAVDSIRTELGVGAVPDVWLQGRYLANPSAHPEVRDYWERAITFVETVHDDETRLYHGAYVASAERAGMSGSMLTLRMAGAAGDFAAGEAARDSLYAAVWNLAAAAISLHDIVVSLQGRVTYEPARGPHLSAAPVIEAVGVDQDAQTRMERALDRVLAAMRPLQNGEVSSAGAKARVPTWIENGLKTLGSGVS